MVTPYEPPPDYPMVDGSWGETCGLNRNPAYQPPPWFPTENQPPYLSHYHQPPPHMMMMMRSRQYPEVAGIYSCEEQPSLRRFTRYNQSIMRDQPVQSPHPSTAFSKGSKKPSFFNGNWTFRDKKPTRPSLNDDHSFRREERPASMNLSDFGRRSRSEISSRQLALGVQEFRVPLRMDRTSMMESRSQPPQKKENYTTLITVDDLPTVVKTRKSEDERNNNEVNSNISVLRKSCPDLESTCAGLTQEFEQMSVAKKKTRRAREKAKHAMWKRKHVEEWSLDDVLLWLQHCQMDEVASLLIGYDIKGSDLVSWDHNSLTQLGVNDYDSRVKILNHLADVRARGPEKDEKPERSHKTLYDIVKQTSYDQVLAVETALTARDIAVTHGRLGCLQITKVIGVNLPLQENDCLLEINERPGEQFRSALMLTKLITDNQGERLRFVVLRRKSKDSGNESSPETSSSGISSSPQTPIE